MWDISNIPLDTNFASSYGLNVTKEWLYDVCVPLINEYAQEYSIVVGKQFNSIIWLSFGLFFIILCLAYYLYKSSKDYKQLEKVTDEMIATMEETKTKIAIEKERWLDDLLLLIQKDCPANKSWGEAVGIYVNAWSETASKNWDVIVRHDYSYKKVEEYFNNTSTNGSYNG